MFHRRIVAFLLLLIGAGIGSYVYFSQTGGTFFGTHPFKLGLDLNGGTHLVYQADVSKIPSGEVNDAMQSLRDVIDNRVNTFGVSEPVVQVEKGQTGTQSFEKLIVELPGVTDVQKAIGIIGQTPSLDFELVVPSATSTTATSTQPKLIPTGITGRFLTHAAVEFDQTTGEPTVSLTFNSEGRDLFAKVTKENVGKVLGIFLDGNPISLPSIREEIRDGKAQISGNFTTKDAKELVRNLNYGALPVPITLVGTQTIGASLGEQALVKSLMAGLLSFLVIAIFLLLWYRLPGLIAVIALSIYTALMLAIFKLIPVTLTSAGLAGFILSIGMAVDANILIFERMKEEFRKGHDISGATEEGFSRAWPSIRDSNFSSMITAVILYWFASSTLIKGFALVFFLGVVVSMLTAVTVSRSLLLALGAVERKGILKFLYGSGLRN